MPLPTSWNLPHYFYDSLTDTRIDADIATWLPISREYAERYKGRIRAFTTPEEVLEYYEYGEAFDMVGKKTMHYLSYLSALDTQDTEVQKKLGELEYLGIQLSELTLFVSQEWKELGADKIRAFAESHLLAAYRNDLIETANNVQYILDEKVEQALNKKSRALGIFGLHEELRSSFEFPWTDEDGVEKKLTEEEIRAFAKNPNRDIRRKAAESMNSVYLVHQNQITLGNLYTGIVKNWSSSMELRGYKTVMSKRNISEQVPDNVVDTLMSEVQKFYPLYQRFLRAKQKHLGLPELFGYDVHAPIFKIEKKIPYEEACKTVIEMFEGFDSRF